MVIGVPDAEPLAGEPDGLAALAEAPLPVVLLLLLLPLLLQAASVPTASAAAPSATAFLENLECFVLTPGSSFLIAHGSADFPCAVHPSWPADARLRGLYTDGCLVPHEERGELRAAVACPARKETATIVCREIVARWSGLSNPESSVSY